MPIITIHTAKPGQGATVTAAALATLCATAGQRTLLIDAATGDLAAVLGMPEPDGPGLAEYLTDLHAPSLDTLAVHIADRLDLLHAGIGGTGPLDLSIIPGGCDRYDTVIIDAGTRPVSGCNADATLLVTRPCYLAIRRAIGAANAATGCRAHQRTRTAEILQRATGIPTRTLAWWLTRLDTAPPDEPLLNAGTVSVVDEASTVSTRDMHRLLRHIHGAGATLRMIGDPPNTAPSKPAACSATSSGAIRRSRRN